MHAKSLQPVTKAVRENHLRAGFRFIFGTSLFQGKLPGRTGSFPWHFLVNHACVVNQIRQSSQLPHIVKMKDGDMDEDKRLLASEEGKKLSSKDRRQLRNKVSARAFRSRRKEYVGQLEGEVALKTNECYELRI